jgi:hypothetical protein
LAPTYGIVVGDNIFPAVQALVPDVTGYAVDYPASFATDSKAKGAADVVKHINSQSKACPKQKFALIGYSQGGDVMHSAAAKLDASLYPSIVALVMFGDPGNKGPGAKSPLGGIVPEFPAPLLQKTKQNCSKGDPVCTNSGTLPDEHLVYPDDALYMKPSAEYIAKQLKMDGKAGAAPSPNGGVQDKGDNSEALKKLGEMLGASPTQLTGFGQ